MVVCLLSLFFGRVGLLLCVLLLSFCDVRCVFGRFSFCVLSIAAFPRVCFSACVLVCLVCAGACFFVRLWHLICLCWRGRVFFIFCAVVWSCIDWYVVRVRLSVLDFVCRLCWCGCGVSFLRAFLYIIIVWVCLRAFSCLFVNTMLVLVLCVCVCVFPQTALWL